MQHIDAAYLRISEDPNDTKRGVTRQREDAIAACSRLGGDPEAMTFYPENDTSAYKKKRIEVTDPMGNTYMGYRVIRPYWHQALHDLRTGKVTRLIVWDLDRLARDPRDLEDAIEAVEHFGATIVSATASEIDLTTESGRMMARLLVLMANKASADTARRVRRAHLATAKEGRPVGGYRPFGWQEDKATLDPAEAEVMRGVIEDAISGVAMRELVRQLNEAGVTTTTGKPWQRQTLRQYLRSPRLVGWRTYQGKVLKDEQDRPVTGLWEPLVTEETWERLQRSLYRPDARGRVPKKGNRRYMLTGVIRCGLPNCGALMYGNRYGEHEGQERFYYTCQGTAADKHTLTISGHGTDELVGDMLVLKIAEESNLPEVEERFPGEERLAELDQLISDLMSQIGRPGVTVEMIFAQVERLGVERDDLRAERDDWLNEHAGPAVTQLTPADWKALSADRQRGLAEKYLSAVYVRPAVKRQNRLDPERIVPVWRGAQRPLAVPAQG